MTPRQLRRMPLPAGGLADARIRILAIVAITMLACIPVFLFLGQKSVWLDEGSTFAYATSPWPTFWHLLTGSQANMALYYLILRPWLHLGSSEVLLRFPSAVFAVAAVPAMYALGAELFNARVGLVAAALLPVNAFFIHYAQEARGYSLALLLIILSSYFFARSIKRPSRWSWALYAVTAILSVYAHFFALLVIGAQWMTLGLLNRRAVEWKRLVATGLLIALALVPVLLFVLFRDTFQLDWVPRPNVGDLFTLFNALAGNGSHLLLWVYLAASGLMAVTGIAVFRRSPRSLGAWSFVFLLAWLLAPIVVAYAFSLWVKPIFTLRYLIVSLPAFVLATAFGVTRLPTRWVVVAAVAVLLVLSSQGLQRWYTKYRTEDWRHATEFVVSHARQGDGVGFFAYFVDSPFNYYLQRLHAVDGPPTEVKIELPPYAAIGRGPGPNLKLLKALPAHYGRFWLVLSHEGNPALNRTDQVGEIQKTLRSEYRQALVRKFKGITVVLYQRAV